MCYPQNSGLVEKCPSSLYHGSSSQTFPTTGQAKLGLYLYNNCQRVGEFHYCWRHCVHLFLFSHRCISYCTRNSTLHLKGLELSSTIFLYCSLWIMQVLTAFKEVYHPDCFRCAVCGVCLDGIPYAGQHDKVYCIKDYHKWEKCDTHHI